MREILAFYVGSPHYQQSLLNENKGYSLNGQATAEIADHQKAIAEEKLKKIETRKKQPKTIKHLKKRKLLNSYKFINKKESDNQNG